MIRPRKVSEFDDPEDLRDFLVASIERFRTESQAGVVADFSRRTFDKSSPFVRIGGGSRLKILEALACRCPVISTRVGAEGLDLTPDLDFLEVDQPKELAEAVDCAIRDYTRLMQTAVNGHQTIQEKYSWDQLSQRLDAIWRTQGAPACTSVIG